MEWVLSRKYREKQTSGCLYVFDGDHSFFNCITLELPWKNNAKNISCYPSGVYNVEKHVRPNGKNAFLVKDVKNRTNILFHTGNYAVALHPDTAGCTLVGFYYDDINDDGEIDILDSTRAFNMLWDIMPDSFKLTVL